MDLDEAVRAAATRLLLAIGFACLFGLIGGIRSRSGWLRKSPMVLALVWGASLGAGTAQFLPGVHSWLYEDGRSAMAEVRRLESAAQEEVRAIAELGASSVAARERLAEIRTRQIAPARRLARAINQETALLERAAVGLLAVSGVVLTAWVCVVRWPAMALILGGMGLIVGAVASWMGSRAPELRGVGWLAIGALGAVAGRVLGWFEPPTERVRGQSLLVLEQFVGPSLAATLASRCAFGAWDSLDAKVFVAGAIAGLLAWRARVGRGAAGVLAVCAGLLWLVCEGMAWRAEVLAGVIGSLLVLALCSGRDVLIRR